MKRSLLILFWIVPCLSIAQTTFRKGYLITNSQDTIRGFISFNEESLNPNAVYYRSDLESKTKVFPLKDCKAYVVENFYSYRREVVNISTSNDNLNRIGVGRDTSVRNDTVFLRVLQPGENVTLFMYSDDIKTRFFIQSKDDIAPLELIRNIYYERQGTAITENKFQLQLYKLMQKYKKDLTLKDVKLEWVGYNADDLIKVVSNINNQAAVEYKAKDTRFFIGAGLSMNSFKYKGSHALANNSGELKTSYSPIIRIGVDYMPKPLIAKVIYRMDATLFMSKNTISNKSADIKHSFEELTVAIAPQVIYTIYNSNMFKFYAGAGISANISNYSNNIMSSWDGKFKIRKSDIDFNTFSFSPKINIGFFMRKKIEFSGSYYLNSSLTDYQTVKVIVSRFAIGANYLFDKY